MPHFQNKWTYEISAEQVAEPYPREISPVISGSHTIYFIANNLLHAITDEGKAVSGKGYKWPFGGLTEIDNYTRPGLQSRHISVKGVPVIIPSIAVLVSTDDKDTLWEDKNNNRMKDRGEIISKRTHVLYALTFEGKIY